MPKRLTIRNTRKPAMSVTRQATRNSRLVYLICTPRAQKYPSKRSRIIYIGTTQTGVHRVAASIAGKAARFLVRRGIRSLDVYVVTCPPRPGIASWRRLERDLLTTFRLEYGRVPHGNTSGKNFTPDRISGLFKYRRLQSVLHAYS